MRRDYRLGLTGILVLALAGGGALSGVASGQPMFDDDDDDDLLDEPGPEPARATLAAAPSADIGVGLRLRQIIVPRGMIELFVERAESGISHPGIGVQVVRRKGDFEVNLGLEWERLAAKPGIWIDKGEMIPQDEVDLVEFEGFGWVTIDATFVWHTSVHEKAALRYGAGLGLGIITGDVLRTDYRCTTSEISSCSQVPGGKVREPEDDIPPVFPVINILVGVQIRPMEKLNINLEGGFRTVPYVGLTADYFF
jgi:hypothetical protein